MNDETYKMTLAFALHGAVPENAHIADKHSRAVSRNNFRLRAMRFCAEEMDGKQVLLHRCKGVDDPDVRIVIHEDDLQSILEEYHTTNGVHHGVNAMMKNISEKYYFYGLHRSTKNYVTRCLSCVRRLTDSGRQRLDDMIENEVLGLNDAPFSITPTESSTTPTDTKPRFETTTGTAYENLTIDELLDPSPSTSRAPPQHPVPPKRAASPKMIVPCKRRERYHAPHVETVVQSQQDIARTAYGKYLVEALKTMPYRSYLTVKQQIDKIVQAEEMRLTLGETEAEES